MRAARPVPFLLLALTACTGNGGVRAAPEYRPLVDRLTRFARHEMADQDIPALSIALVDRREVVWTGGFGVLGPDDSTAADGATVFGADGMLGLFTTLAALRLVEDGRLALDSAVAGFPGTLRDALAALAGSVDTTMAPGMQWMGESTRRPALDAVAGAVERAADGPVASYLDNAVLRPLRLERTTFGPIDRRARVAAGRRWSYGGDPERTLPSAEGDHLGGLRAPVGDLAWLAEALLAGGVGERGRVLAESTTALLLAPTGRRGLGVAVTEVSGQRLVGYCGAGDGYSSCVWLAPDAQLAVVVSGASGGVVARVDRIAQYGMRLLIARRPGVPAGPPELTDSVPDALARRAVGSYGRGDRRVVIARRGDSLRAWISRPGVRVRLRARGDTLVVDDRLWYGPRLVLLPGAIVVRGDTLARQPDRPPARSPAAWQPLIGEYRDGPDPLMLFERDGALVVLVDRFFAVPLEVAGRDRYRLAAWGPRPGAGLDIERDPSGAVAAVRLDGRRFPRTDPGAGAFRVTPRGPLDSLLAAAQRATPPADSPGVLTPDLVELRALDPTIRLDVRYAGANNFLGAPVYPVARALLQRPAAEALVRAHRRLAADGLGLVIYDAYRPWYVTRTFWDATPDSLRSFVADPARGSRHNRGAAVDVGLVERATGRPADMPSGYDEFTARAHPDYPGGTTRARWHRDRLRAALEAEGFTVYRYEWWHYDYTGWERYPLLNLRFAEVPASAR